MQSLLPKLIWVASALAVASCPALGCEASRDDYGSGEADADTDADVDTDADADGDSDSDADGDGDSDADADADSDTDADSDGPMEQDCSGCANTGTTIEEMLCAIDLCDETVVTGQELTSPTGDDLSTAYAAVNRFGSPENDLAPLLNGSYALMACGPATGTSHSADLEGGGSTADPFSSDTGEVNDVVEWRIHLTAPEDAHGFEFYYVFFSVEYDEYIGSVYNDKFYVFKSSQGSDADRQVINFTDCRKPEAYSDFTCAADDPIGATALAAGACNEGQKYCYVAINSALSDCCWYGGCPDGAGGTDIAGTGFVCANTALLDVGLTGSSTGWLKTSWPCEPGEEFDIVFHIHDTSDGILDSEVILDSFRFVGAADPGTVPVE